MGSLIEGQLKKENEMLELNFGQLIDEQINGDHQIEENPETISVPRLLDSLQRYFMDHTAATITAFNDIAQNLPKESVHSASDTNASTSTNVPHAEDAVHEENFKKFDTYFEGLFN